MRKYFVFIVIALALVSILFQGCAESGEVQTGDNDDSVAIEGLESSAISMDDLNMVNEYVKQTGAEEIPLDAAEDINLAIVQNTNTKEIKTSWQLLVDYVNNENSDGPKDIGNVGYQRG